MLPAVHVQSSVEGRTRLKAVDPALRHNGFLGRVQRELQGLPGIDDAKANPVTGTILVRHKLPLAELARAAEERRLFHVEREDAPDAAARRAPTTSEVGGLTLLGLAAYQAVRGDLLPAALPLALQALALLRKDHRDVPTYV